MLHIFPCNNFNNGMNEVVCTKVELDLVVAMGDEDEATATEAAATMMVFETDIV